MNLGIYLPLGDSFTNLSKSGQDVRFKKFYLDFFSKQFDKIFVFSYENEIINGLPKNVKVIGNRFGLHRYIYGLLLPLFCYKYIRECDIFRVYHLIGCIPAIVGKLVFKKKFLFNYAYDYKQFTLIENKKFQYYLLWILQPLAFIFADKIIAANKKLYNKLKSDKVVYIPNGVDTDFFCPKRRKFSKRPRNILSVGRLERQKNYFNLIKAIKGMEVKLTLVGSGSLSKSFLDIAKENQVFITIINKVDNLKMPGIYQKADVFVLPSLSAGHPKVLLEAMSCALPCIGTKVAGIKELIENHKTGILCGTNVLSIRKAIEYLIDKPVIAKELGKNAREVIRKKYELRVLLKEEVEYLKNL